MQKKEDRRTCRTKKAIKQAFTQLIIEKDYKEISVTELAELAGINRKTFYSHYECMDDVLDELHEDIVEQLFAIHGKNAREKFDITDFAVTINEMLADNYNLYRRLIVANEYRFFSRKVRDSLKETFIAHYLRDSSLSSEVINFVRLGFLDSIYHSCHISDITEDEVDFFLCGCTFKVAEIQSGLTSYKTIYVIALFQQKLCEVRTVLSCYACDKCIFHDLILH